MYIHSLINAQLLPILCCSFLHFLYLQQFPKFCKIVLAFRVNLDIIQSEEMIIYGRKKLMIVEANSENHVKSLVSPRKIMLGIVPVRGFPPFQEIKIFNYLSTHSLINLLGFCFGATISVFVRCRHIEPGFLVQLSINFLHLISKTFLTKK